MNMSVSLLPPEGPPPLETCFHMIYRMAADMRLYSIVHGNRKGELLSCNRRCPALR